ncbi:IS1 family transposase, partial [Escherichia coli]
LGRKSLSFSKSVELHDKVIGHYLNIITLSVSWSHYRHRGSTNPARGHWRERYPILASNMQSFTQQRLLVPGIII